MRSRYFHGASALAVALTAGWATGAWADTPTAGTTVGTVEVVAPTGSYIQRETTALPVDVVSTQDLQRQGNPTVLQLVKTITASSSGLGESNRYNGGAGTASINLRGFGSSRTLVLFNGHRMPDTTAAAFQGGGVNLNSIPTAPIGRIEILKDGAAATYGSEAIGGVVNFITRTDLNGFDVNGQYTFINGSDGDYQGSIAYGHRFDRGNVLLTAGYRHRSQIDIHDRDWAIGPFYAAAAGGYSGNSNPGNYNQNLLNVSPQVYAFRDNGCTQLGGTLTSVRTLNNISTGGTTTITTPVNALNPETSTSATTCQFQFSNFNNIVEEEDHYQLYAEVNFDLSDSVRFHGEASWARDAVPHTYISPANGNTQFPTPRGMNCMAAFLPSPPNPPNTCPAGQSAPGGGQSGSLARAGAQDFFVPYNLPANNPGLQDLRNQCIANGSVGVISASECTLVIAAGAAGGPGLDMSQTNFRFIANAGRPFTPRGEGLQSNEINTFRVLGGFRGDFNPALHWDVSALWGEAEGVTHIEDLLVDRVQLALNGFGSATGAAPCTAAATSNFTTGAGTGNCHFFNPMSNAIAVSATNGQTNPFYRGAANPAVINDPNVIDWMYGPYNVVATNQIFTADAVVNGDTPLHLWGGAVQFALGAQYRWNRTLVHYGDFFNNQVYPCVDSILNMGPNCGAPNGPLIFFGSARDSDTNRNVVAGFGELRLPVTDTFEVTAAARYEQYDNGIGSTFNPKLSARWQVFPWLALRGSAGTTFRAPDPGMVNPSCATGVANLAGQYRAVRTCGNPNLTPETAHAYNAGFIVQGGGFNVTLDYFRILFHGELTTEGASNLVASLNCATSPQALLDRFQFAGGVCSAPNILRVDTFWVNGPGTRASGVDFRATYDRDWLFDAHWQVGIEATYLIEYARGAFTLLGAPAVTFAPAFDRAGSYDFLSAFFSYPQTKANAWLNFHRGPLNVRWQVQYTEGVRPAINTISTIVVPNASDPFGYDAVNLGKSDDFWQHNLEMQYQVGSRYTLTLGVENIFDQDPPFVVSNFNYDYTNGNPLGRTITVGARARF
jgi:iron complex outermembrane receptor protein